MPQLRNRPLRQHRLPIDDGLTNGGHIARGMRTIQDAHRVRRVQINKALTPLGPIHHRADLLGALQPTPMEFGRCLRPKALAAREP
jgi:hypothetical protein